MKNLLFMLAAATCFTIAASAATVTLTGNFGGGLEATPNASPGTGLVTVIVNDSTNAVNVTLNYTGMQTASINAGIYCCAIPVAGIELPRIIQFTSFPVGTSGTYSGSFSTSPSNIASMENGGAYVNIITDGYSHGEIRADLVATNTPEPGSFALIGLTLTALGLVKFRRK